MAKTIKVGLGVEDSINLFMEHYKYGGDDYNLSTVLTDAGLNIIAYFDRGSNDIVNVQGELDWNYDMIIANGKKIYPIGKIKYRPLDYNILVRSFKERINELKSKGESVQNIYDLINEKVKDYNTNLFKNIENRIKEQ